MRHLLTTLLLLSVMAPVGPQPRALTAFSAPVPVAAALFGSAKVYVCISRESVAYHSDPECKGLGKCTHIVRKVTTSVAEKLGKRACKTCM